MGGKKYFHNKRSRFESLFYKQTNIVPFLVFGNVRFLAKTAMSLPNQMLQSKRIFHSRKEVYKKFETDNWTCRRVLQILGALSRGSILSYSFVYKNLRASSDASQMTFLTNSSFINESNFYLLSLLNMYLGSATFSIFLIRGCLHAMIVSRILVMKCDLHIQPSLCLFLVQTHYWDLTEILCYLGYSCFAHCRTGVLYQSCCGLRVACT